MLVSPDETIILDYSAANNNSSSPPEMWCYRAPFDQPPEVLPYPNGKRGFFIPGRNGWFGLKYSNRENDVLEVLAFRFDDPLKPLASTRRNQAGEEQDGDPEAWSNLERALLTYQATDSDEPTDAYWLGTDGALYPLVFQWFRKGHYDRGYQAPTNIAVNPYTDELLVSIQRSNIIIICGPRSGKAVANISLVTNASGSGRIIIDTEDNVFWTIAYNTLNRVSLSSYHVEAAKLIQPAINNKEHGKAAMLFAGRFILQPEKHRVCIARPYSGDVIAVDMTTLDTVAVAKTGGHPLDLVVVGDEIIAKEWKTGRLIRGQFSSV